MRDDGLMGQRIRWARQQQGITLQLLSERSHKAVSYLSQLETGVKRNPTMQTVEALASALYVRPAFLLGEVPGPLLDRSDSLRSPAESAHPGDSKPGQAFALHWEGLADAERFELSLADPVQRFTLVIGFLLERFAENFTPIELAWQLGMSAGQFQAILTEGQEVSHTFMAQLANLTGIPLCFFTQGRFQVAAPAPALQAEALHYLEAIRLAMASNLSPQRLEALIRLARD
jgi:transcriptional regulator with XRE-family HTH domain